MVRSPTASRMRERPKQRANFHRERCGADHPAIHAQPPRHASAAQSLDGTRLTGSLPVPGDRNVGSLIRLRKTATRPCDRPAAGPKLTQILRQDLAGQDQQVQESVVSTVEFPPGAAAPWHLHTGAQEILYTLEGNLIVEVEGREPITVKAGQCSIIPADIPSSGAQRQHRRGRESPRRAQPQRQGKAPRRSGEENDLSAFVRPGLRRAMPSPSSAAHPTP